MSGRSFPLGQSGRPYRLGPPQNTRCPVWNFESSSHSLKSGIFDLTELAVLGAEALPKTATEAPRTHTEGFGCVYITSSGPDAERAAVLVRQSEIRIYHAYSLAEAQSLMRRTRCRVLLSDTVFSDGDWKSTLETVWRLWPRIALVVASRSIDEALWISVLELGAYDLVQKPFRAEELRCVLENAYAYSIRPEPRLFMFMPS